MLSRRKYVGSLLATAVGATLSAELGSANAQTGTTEERLTVDRPRDREKVGGDYTLKAFVPKREVSSYEIFWYADPNDRHRMDDNPDLNIKYYNIDFSKWTWNQSGRYEIVFAARDKKTKQSLGAASVQIEVIRA